MNPRGDFPASSGPLGLLLGLLLGLAAASGPATAQLARVAERAAPQHERLTVRDAHGAALGRLTPHPHDGDLLTLELRDGTRLDAPRYQRWLASSDGRSVVALGDPRAPEHPFSLSVALWRDGRAVPTPPLVLAPESSVALAADGRLAVVGHAPDQRQQWLALVLDAHGERLLEVPLPAGAQAADPVFAGEALLVRTHGSRAAGGPGAVVRIDREGVRTLLESIGPLQLVELGGRVLLRERDALVCLDPRTGAVAWRRTLALRPVGPHAWATRGDLLAVLHTGLRRRGAATPPVELTVLDAGDGRTLGSSREVTRRRAPAQARLATTEDGFVVSWEGVEEVFRWQR